MQHSTPVFVRTKLQDGYYFYIIDTKYKIHRNKKITTTTTTTTTNNINKQHQQ